MLAAGATSRHIQPMKSSYKSAVGSQPYSRPCSMNSTASSSCLPPAPHVTHGAWPMGLPGSHQSVTRGAQRTGLPGSRRAGEPGDGQGQADARLLIKMVLGLCGGVTVVPTAVTAPQGCLMADAVHMRHLASSLAA